MATAEEAQKAAGSTSPEHVSNGADMENPLNEHPASVTHGIFLQQNLFADRKDDEKQNQGLSPCVDSDVERLERPQHLRQHSQPELQRCALSKIQRRSASWPARDFAHLDPFRQIDAPVIGNHRSQALAQSLSTSDKAPRLDGTQGAPRLQTSVSTYPANTGDRAVPGHDTSSCPERIAPESRPYVVRHPDGHRNDLEALKETESVDYPAPEPPKGEKEEDPWADIPAKKNKKKRKGASVFSWEPEPEPEPKPAIEAPPPPPPEPEKPAEENPWGFATVRKKKKGKKGKAKPEPVIVVPEPEPESEPVPESKPEPVVEEKKEDDGWDGFGMSAKNARLDREIEAEANALRKRRIPTPPVPFTGDHVSDKIQEASSSGSRAKSRMPLKEVRLYKARSSDSGYSSMSAASRTSATSSEGPTIRIIRRDATYTIPLDGTVSFTTPDGDTWTVGSESSHSGTSHHNSHADHAHPHAKETGSLVSRDEPPVSTTLETASKRHNPTSPVPKVDDYHNDESAMVSGTRKTSGHRSNSSVEGMTRFRRADMRPMPDSRDDKEDGNDSANDLSTVYEEEYELPKRSGVATESPSFHSPSSSSSGSRTNTPEPPEPEAEATFASSTGSGKARVYGDVVPPVYSPTSSDSNTSGESESWEALSEISTPPPPCEPSLHPESQSKRIRKTKKTDRHTSRSLSTKSFLTTVLQVSDEIIQEITAALVTADELHFMLMALVLDPNTVQKEVRTRIQLTIQKFGEKLQLEAGSALEKAVGVAFQDSVVSERVTDLLMRPSKVVQRCGKTTIADADKGDFREAHIDRARQRFEVQTPCVKEAAIWHEIFTQSRAFPVFKADLMNLAHDPYEQRIRYALDDTIFSEKGHRLASPEQTIRELSWVPPHLLSFSFHQPIGVIDRLKGFVEDSMNEAWNWWPLAPRLHKLRADCCRLRWQSPCGRSRHIDLPVYAADALQRAVKTAPAFLRVHSLDTDIRRSTVGDTQAGQGHTPSPAVPYTLQNSATSSRPPSKSPSAQQLTSSPTPGVTSGLQSSGSYQQQLQTVLSVHLCVEAGFRQFIELDCRGIDADVKFFEKIKSEYETARGWPRLWFSTWCYDYCEFYKFQITGVRLGARIRPDFPKPSDQRYRYDPRPPRELPPDGPISHDEFHEHYYWQDCPSFWTWERWYGRQAELSTSDKQALAAVPKRIVKLDMENSIHEDFYGLYAKEARSALRVAIYAVLCNSPGFIFFFLWLRQRGQGSDLQGAAVPVQLSLSLTVAFLGVLYWTR